MVVTKEEFETRAAALIGKCVTKVLYGEIDYCDGLFHFFDDQRFDSLDHGLELTFGDGEQWTIDWGWDFYPYGVSLNKTPCSSRWSSDRVLDVSASPRWYAIIGKRIIASEIFWPRIEEHEKPISVQSWIEECQKPDHHWNCSIEEYKNPRNYWIYPQNILLRFEGGENEKVRPPHPWPGGLQTVLR
jgi:hypothetical protein